MRVSTEPVFVGCEIFIRKGDSILLGLRKNIYGDGTWALPGGHQEHNERLVDAAVREIKEEVGLNIRPADLTIVSITDGLIQKDGERHYVHISFELHSPAGEPQLMEPDECAEWRYFKLDELPDTIFPPHRDIIENYVNRRLYVY